MIFNRSKKWSIDEAVRLIQRAGGVVALTGAGISVESGIPSFRGAQGLWEKFDPMEYAHIDALRAHPEKVWHMLHELYAIVGRARPNPAHFSLAEMESLGFLRAIITLNIDHLHQDSGSRNVIEFHGSGHQMTCLDCGVRCPSQEVDIATLPPRCLCGGLLKPDVVFFGEPIPWRSLVRAQEETKRCNVMLVVGTSAVVAPACDMPHLAKKHRAKVIEINPEETPLTGTVTDVFLRGSAGEILSEIVPKLREPD
jgi:NAD-dependent deacetylase